MINQLFFNRSRYVLITAFVLLVISVVITMAIGMSRIDRAHQRLHYAVYAQRIKAPLISSLLEANQQRTEIIYNLSSSMNNETKARSSVRYRESATQFQEAIDKLQKLELSILERRAITQVMQAARYADGIRARVLEDLAQNSDGRAQRLLIEYGIGAQVKLQQALYRLVETQRSALLDETTKANRETRTAFLLMAAAACAILALGSAIGFVILRYTLYTERALYREKERAEATLHSVDNGVITTDAVGMVEHLNPTAEVLTGWRNEDAIGKPLKSIYQVLDEKTRDPLDYRAPNSHLNHAKSERAKHLIHKNGSERIVHDYCAPIHDWRGHAVGMIIVFQDISQVQAMSQLLSWQSTHDTLTGLTNRRGLERKLRELLQTASLLKKEHALLYIDLDNFRAINDAWGHNAGDALLRQLALVLQTRMRASDVLSYLGADEFCALLEACPPDQALRIANGIREAIRHFRFSWLGSYFNISASIGLVSIDANSESAGEILQAASASCAYAKRQGRDRVEVYQQYDSDYTDKQGALHIVSQISEAFEQSRFQLFRQKIISLNGADEGRPHYEVLVRMLDADGNLVPPSIFIPAAERYNLLTRIDRWVLTTLAEFLKDESAKQEYIEAGFYTANLSGASVNDSSFPDFIRKLLTHYNLPQGLLCFELTETTAVSNLDKAAQLMQELKAMGCKFALDDFGIGMSSFAYLKYLPVDYLKIDGTFIKDMATDTMGYAIVEAINRISHILGMQTIAEYVEDEQTLTKLKEMNVDFAQGFIIAKPEAITQLPEMEQYSPTPDISPAPESI